MSKLQEPQNYHVLVKEYKLPFVLGLFLLVSLVVNVILYRKVDTAVSVKPSNAKVAGAFDAATDIEAALLAVQHLLVLPTDEMPTIATITDLTKVKAQPFFAHAQVGDKVLVYTAAKKAVLYRPAENKIVELGPVSDDSDK